LYGVVLVQVTETADVEFATTGVGSESQGSGRDEASGLDRCGHTERGCDGCCNGGRGSNTQRQDAVEATPSARMLRTAAGNADFIEYENFMG